MNKYIEYIKKMKADENVDEETYIYLIKGFKIKLETWLAERPRFSDDPDFIEMTTAIKHISDVIKSGDCCNNPSYAGTKQFDICSNCRYMKTPTV